MPTAAIVFKFDPYADLIADLAVRWGTIALALAIVLALILAAVLARGGGLRIDDIAFIAVGIVPGAVIGGRLGFALEHWSFYGANPGVLIDPSVGGLDLGLGVVGATLSGACVASLLGAPLGRWLHLAAAPALFVIGAGKLSMVLTGSGQGLPSDEPWATAYAGPGPWGSVGPLIPSHPSQAYEGIATLAILALLALVLTVGGFGRRDGRLFYVAIGLWALARTAVSTTWRDPVLAAGLPTGGVISVAIAIGCVVVVLALTIRRPSVAADSELKGDTESEAALWPEPAQLPDDAPDATDEQRVRDTESRPAV